MTHSYVLINWNVRFMVYGIFMKTCSSALYVYMVKHVLIYHSTTQHIHIRSFNTLRITCWLDINLFVGRCHMNNMQRIIFCTQLNILSYKVIGLTTYVCLPHRSNMQQCIIIMIRYTKSIHWKKNIYISKFYTEIKIHKKHFFVCMKLWLETFVFLIYLSTCVYDPCALCTGCGIRKTTWRYHTGRTIQMKRTSGTCFI